MVDIDVNITETKFTLVMLGTEGSDYSKGQVRLYVDDHSCDDPGEAPDPAVPYNKILPNAKNEVSIGMDYCAGGTLALDNKDHTLKAQLWHGETPLIDSAGDEISDTITFHTTYMDTGAAGASSM